MSKRAGEGKGVTEVSLACKPRKGLLPDMGNLKKHRGRGILKNYLKQGSGQYNWKNVKEYVKALS